MKIGFNEGSDWKCKNHTVLKDLEYCEKYGFQYIDIQSACLDEDLRKDRNALNDISSWLKGHSLKVNSYNALCDFNMCPTKAEKDRVMAELEEDIIRCRLLNTDTIILVPRGNLNTAATIPEIHDDAVMMLKEMLQLAAPEEIRLALEFCGQPDISINRFEDAYSIVEEINSNKLGVVLDQYHFHAMASGWDALEKAHGSKIFIWHFTDTEDLPCGASYNKYENRLWPGDPRGCMDMRRYVNTLKNIGYAGNVCMLEVFRPEYYELTQEENVKKSAVCMKKFVSEYCTDF